MAAAENAEDSEADVTIKPRVGLKAGEYVRHSKYGWGTVINSNRAEMVVYFRTIGVKRLEPSAKFAFVRGDGFIRKVPA